MDELNMVGITMGCSILGRQLSDVMFDPIYAELDRRSATLFLHPTGDMLTEVFDESGRLNFLVGFYMEDTLAALRLAQARVPSRYPRMNIIVPHLGGLLPLLIARLERAASPVLEELRKMWFDTLNDQVDVVSCACNALGSDRFVYGTDYPFANEAEYEQRLTRLTQLGLAVEEVDEIQGSRAARLLKISL
jgi:aminocarboxymuconate-semialdehyde decarboxylase